MKGDGAMKVEWCSNFLLRRYEKDVEEFMENVYMYKNVYIAILNLIELHKINVHSTAMTPY